MTLFPRIALAWLLLCAAAGAGAHEFWMLPGSFHAAAGSSTTLSLAVGENFTGEPIAFAPELVVRLQHFAAGTRRDLATRTQNSASSAAISVELPRAGTHLFALDTQPSFIELPAEKFHAYLRQEGLEHVIVARQRAGADQAAGRERYRRHVKTLVQAGAAGDGTFAQRTGQRLEIVPLADPAKAQPGQPFPFELRFAGRPLAGALLKAWRHGEGALLTAQGVSDAEGRVSLALPQAGAWMTSVVHMVPARERGIDWDSHWGNLSLALGPPDQAVSTAPRK